LHGANRLASNSLLERWFLPTGGAGAPPLGGGAAPPAADSWVVPSSGAPREDVIVNHNWISVRRLMWDYVGIVRTGERLREAAARLQLIREEVDRFYRRFAVEPDLLELRNITLVAGIILRLAAARLESRGLHVNREYPAPDDLHFRRDSVLGRVGDVSWGGTIAGSHAVKAEP